MATKRKTFKNLLQNHKAFIFGMWNHLMVLYENCSNYGTGVNWTLTRRVHICALTYIGKKSSSPKP